MHFKPFC